VFKHVDYESMERPAPKSASPTVLYVDMRQSSLSPDEVLDAAYTEVGKDAVGFQVFSAQKTLALVFSDVAIAKPYLGRPLGDTGLSLYAARLRPLASSSLPSKVFPSTTPLVLKTL